MRFDLIDVLQLFPHHLSGSESLFPNNEPLLQQTISDPLCGAEHSTKGKYSMFFYPPQL